MRHSPHSRSLVLGESFAQRRRYWITLTAGLFLAAAALFLAGIAHAAEPASTGSRATRAGGTAGSTYQRDVARCDAGQTYEDKRTCLREAGAAREQAGELGSGTPDEYRRNALARCDPLPAQDRADCRARIEGQGTEKGSVAGGGIYRQLVTETVGAPGSGGTSKPTH